MMIRKHPVTFSLIAVNVAVFAFFAITQQSLLFSTYEDYLAILWAGANYNPLTLTDEPWRLFTSMFLHGNIVHLGINMYGLFSIGRDIEEDDNSLQFFLVYMIAGVIGGLASLSFNVFSASVGASGAIFGLYGYQIVSALILHRRNKDAVITIIIHFVVFAGINTIVALAVNQGSFGFIIDTAAHLGGLAAGVALALWHGSKIAFTSPALGLILLVSFASHYFLPKDQVSYYRAYRAVINAEDHQNKLYQANLSDHQIADSLKRTLSEWDSARLQLEGLPYVNPDLRNDTSVLKQYSTLRKEMTQFIILQVEKESYVYLDSQEIVGIKMNALPGPKYHPILKDRRARSPVPEEPEEAPAGYQQVRVFYDSNWRETSEDRAAYYREGVRDSLLRWQGKVKDYYRDGTIQMKGAYKDGMSHGVFLYYSHEGKYESAGKYDEENPVGKWEEYHPNGKLHRETDFRGISFIRNVYDTAGRLQVVYGEGTEVNYHPNGVIAETGKIYRGRKEGVWKGYHPNGKQYFEEFYRDNILIRGMSIDVTGARHIYDQSSFYPAPQIGMKAYEKYLADNLRREGLPFREGQVKLLFSVDKDGTLHDFVVLKSVCIPCDQEAIRLVKEGPPWRPALSRGHVKETGKGIVEVNF